MPSHLIGRLFREISGFSEILTDHGARAHVPVGGGIFGRPAIAVRGLSGASHLEGLTEEG